ncbi:hypothetical protein CB1_001130007 [Camelus ferus]|nr:hypothetical protein CB1_001130007 [Camelus ferus]
MSFRGGGRGGFNREENRYDEIAVLGEFLHPCEDDIVCKCTTDENKVPYFNAPVYLENKEQIGKVDEIFGQLRDFAEHNIVAAYLITAGVISILSNIIVLGIFVKYKELRTPTNAIIINLAVTDIGVSSIGYPMSAASDLYGSWKFGYAGCQIYAGLNIFFGMASIGLLTVVAMDRYLTICRPDAEKGVQSILLMSAP